MSDSSQREALRIQAKLAGSLPLGLKQLKQCLQPGRSFAGFPKPPDIPRKETLSEHDIACPACKVA